MKVPAQSKDFSQGVWTRCSSVGAVLFPALRGQGSREVSGLEGPPTEVRTYEVTKSLVGMTPRAKLLICP